MINVTHLNVKRPPLDVVVFAVDQYGDCRSVKLMTTEQANVDPEDFGDHDVVWYDEDNGEDHCIDSYPFWTEYEFNIPKMADYNVKRVVDAPGAISIPGYKIVGGCVVKA